MMAKRKKQPAAKAKTAVATAAPKLSATKLPGGDHRVELNCARCVSSVLVMTVAANKADPSKPDADALADHVRNAGWGINRVGHPFCTDCK